MTVGGDSFLKMDEACKATRKLISDNPIQRDGWDGFMAARAWPFVTALYSGIEQALKMLLQLTDSNFTLQTLKASPYAHNLQRLHADLSPADKEHIELHFGEHWGLFEFEQLDLTFDTAEGFISHVNGSGNGHGYISWRYTLVDPSVQIPATDLWTMWEIWEAVCCRIRARLSKRGGTCLALSQRLIARLDDLIPEVSPYVNFSDDLLRWRASDDNGALGAWLDVLVKANRGAVDQVRAPERLRPELALMADRAIEELSQESAGPDEKQFLWQVQRTDRDLVWDARSHEFGWADTG
ncbi:hypothetical protein [Candidatus Poriferisodalis sp.]|uniref:hypothetical protein n=1 Tax=Candidatus Poriferisodalis sp. TaxID=3101277 RepID=UPI003B011226